MAFIYMNIYRTSLDTGRNPTRPFPVGVMTGMSKQKPYIVSQAIPFFSPSSSDWNGNGNIIGSVRWGIRFSDEDLDLNRAAGSQEWYLCMVFKYTIIYHTNAKNSWYKVQQWMEWTKQTKLRFSRRTLS